MFVVDQTKALWVLNNAPWTVAEPEECKRGAGTSAIYYADLLICAIYLWVTLVLLGPGGDMEREYVYELENIVGAHCGLCGCGARDRRTKETQHKWHPKPSGSSGNEPCFRHHHWKIEIIGCGHDHGAKKKKASSDMSDKMLHTTLSLVTLFATCVQKVTKASIKDDKAAGNIPYPHLKWMRSNGYWPKDNTKQSSSWCHDKASIQWG